MKHGNHRSIVQVNLSSTRGWNPAESGIYVAVYNGRPPLHLAANMTLD
jgi:hypothetical protein